jgi:hypothetical protein
MLPLAAFVVSCLTFACGEHCGNPGATCSTAPFYDLVLTEADSGKAGITLGGGVAFLLDGRRDRLVTSPVVTVHPLGDPLKQFPGMHAFAIYGGLAGVFDVTATGPGLAPFTFHLVAGGLLQTGFTVLKPGALVVQEYPPAAQPTDLRSPTFELVQDAVAVGFKGGLLSQTPAPTRRAYRAAQPGAQLDSTSTTRYLYRVLVADAPSDFMFVDAEVEVPVELETGSGTRFAVVLAGDRRTVSWRAIPDYAVVRLPDADVGPQPPGATLLPFRAMVWGKTALELHTASRTITLTLGAYSETCLPDDFPSYPLAQLVTISYSGLCHEDMSSSDPPAQVLAFYRVHLNEGGWRVVSERDAQINYERTDYPVNGTLSVDNTGIHIQMNRG